MICKEYYHSWNVTLAWLNIDTLKIIKKKLSWTKVAFYRQSDLL